MAMTQIPQTCRLLLMTLALSLSTGCFWFTTKHEGKQLRTDVKRLDKRVTSKETDLETKIKQLQSVLDEATRMLRRNSADLGADFETIKQQMRTVDGLIAAAKLATEDVGKQVQTLKQSMDNDREVMAKRLESMEQRLMTLETEAKKKPRATSPGELYASAKTAFDSGEYDKARKLFKQMVIRFPGHSRADDSQYYRGEAFYKNKQYDDAIRELQKVFDKYRKSSFADDALYRAGEAAQKLKRCSEARAYFGLLRQSFPSSSLLKKAKAKDKELRKNSKKKRKCTS